MQGDCRKSFSIPRGNRIIIHSSINISITTIDRSTGLIVHSIRRGARPVIAEGNVDPAALLKDFSPEDQQRCMRHR